MNDSRTSNSIKNSLSAVIANSCAIIIGFVAQAIFIRILGAEYLGLNGLFTNILTMLGLFELGIGNAIVYNMYKPIANKDTEKIKSLLHFYKKSYNIIAFVVFIIGMCILPFIKNIVGEVTVDINIYVIYFLFLSSTIASYLMVYKRNMLYASQQNYIINIIHCIYLVILNILQLTILYITKNYYLYLIVKIICQLFENIAISYLCNRIYPYVKEKNYNKIDVQTEKSIFAKVKALIYHKIGYVIINGTDNIIISKFFGVITVGLYANYYVVINAVTTLFSQVITSLTASVGNLIICEDSKKVYSIFKKVRFCNFWISCFTGTCILVIMQPFIKIWVGEQYLLSNIVLFVLTFNFFQKMQRSSYGTFKDSAGIWEQDKFVPLFESALNVFFSILLLKICGLSGVFIGTIISGLALWCYSYPKFVYKKLFNRSYKQYAKETIGYVVLFIGIAAITYEISTLIVLNNLILQILVNAIISLIMPNLIMFLIFRKSENFEYFAELLKKIQKKLYGKISKKSYECQKEEI